MIAAADHPRLVKLVEWECRTLPDLALSFEDHALLDTFKSTSETKFGIDQLQDGLRICAYSWVGAIRFSQFELQIIPKLVGAELGLAKIIDFAAGLDALCRVASLRTFDAQGASLLDLVAMLLAEACEKIARTGLLADYHEIEEDLPVIRGRLLACKQVLNRFGRIDRVECRYDDHTTQTIENQLVFAALGACGRRVRDPAIALRVRRLMTIFSEACTLDGFDLRAARTTLSYNRLNEHYRIAHGLAWLILDGLGIQDIYGGEDYRRFAFLLDMNQLFENFVTRWFQRLFQGTQYRIHAQRRDSSILWNADLGTPYTRIIPDLLVERSGLFLPVDAKYKLYDEKNVSNSDIYQTFLYAYTYGESHALLPTAIIIYPASNTIPSRIRLHIRRTSGLPSAELVCLGIHMPSVLAEFEQETIGEQSQRVKDQIAKCFPVR